MASENYADIAKRHYATDEHLRIRQETHARYTVPERNFADWVLQRVELHGGETVLDVGSGPGLYYEPLKRKYPDIRYTGIELVAPMVKHHPDRAHVLVGDAQHLPFPDQHFDLVMANHMLHHVPDMDQALREIRRVLKPGGSVTVATNSVQTMPELQVLMRRAIVLLTRTGAASVRAPEIPTDRFALENGTRKLSEYFYAVVRHDLPSALVFPDVEPAMAYLESTRDLREHSLPEDVVWEDVMMIMRQQINQLIKHLGELVINKQAGVLVASDSGGFIGKYVALQQQAGG